MEFNEYQDLAWQTAIYPDKGNNLYYPGLGLGEAGEVQNKIKKVMRDHNGVVTDEYRELIKGELGDTIWYIAAVCSELNINMNDVAEENIKKLFSRKDRNVLKGNGDNR